MSYGTQEQRDLKPSTILLMLAVIKFNAQPSINSMNEANFNSDFKPQILIHSKK